MTPLLSTTGLTKQFDTNVAVNQVDLTVNAGDIYGLIGPNGAGKTTLLRMLATAEEPTTGNIYIQGQRWLPDQPSPEIQRIIGFLPDDFPLYDDLSVVDYLEYFARLYYLPEPEVKSRINAVLAMVSLENKRHSLISALSRGMKQRLSLARTVIYRPTLLLLDEPVSGLDPIARVQYRETIKALQREGMTIVISSHILSDLEDFCTAIGVMESGRLVESSQLQDLYKRDRPHQQFIVATLDNPDALQTILQHSPLVTACERLPDSRDRPSSSNQDRPIANTPVASITIYRLSIQFTGDTTDAAELLRSLIQAGHVISEFAPVKETLEDIFLELGYNKTA
ncbi:MAG: ATP-binding cassette domain-containing protein [Leptolyngbyaceae cyanobacterium]